MKTSDKERLLKDVLENEEYCAARSETRHEVLLKARQQPGRSVLVWRGLALAACVPIAVGVYVLLMLQKPPMAAKGGLAAVVHTQALEKDEIVKTAGGQDPRGSRAEVLIVTTASADIEVVRSKRATEEISDQQLLDLFKGQPVALVTVSPHERHLILPTEQ